MDKEDEEVKLVMLSEASAKENGVEDDRSAAVTTVPLEDDEDGDADGQSADKSLDKPKKRNLFFKDGVRRIDFVLAWVIRPEEELRKPKEVKQAEEAKEARRIFEENLVKEGLHLEYDHKGPERHFVKVHAPFDVLKRYADILKLRMPMKEVGFILTFFLNGIYIYS